MPRKQGEGRIETTDWSWSPVKGRCGFAQEGNACDYCWEEIFYKRFGHGKKPINQELRLDEKELKWCPREPSRIAVCYSTDLFHRFVNPEWIKRILEKVREHPENAYQFLTKCPWNLSHYDFPDNAWVGTSLDGTRQTNFNLVHSDFNLVHLVQSRIGTRIKYVFFEPLIEFPLHLLLKRNLHYWESIDWIVIGADSRKGAEKPDPEWAERLIEHARKFEIAVFVKDNYPGYEFPPKEFPGDIL